MSTVIEERASSVDLTSLAKEPFVSVTTFKRDGTPVSTPVWCVPDDGALLVITEAGSGKVKRLRHDPHVRIAACGARGKVHGQVIDAEASLAEDTTRVEALLTKKYGWQWRGYRAYMRLTDRIRRKGPRPGMTIRITTRRSPT